MATTRPLNDSHDAYCTTFYGGALGRCYQFTVIKDGVKATAKLTEEEFFSLLAGRGDCSIDDGIRPSFDRN